MDDADPKLGQSLWRIGDHVRRQIGLEPGEYSKSAAPENQVLLDMG